MLCLPVCLQPPQRESWGAQDAKNEHTHQFKCEPPEIPGLRLHGVGSRQVYRKLEAQRTRSVQGTSVCIVQISKQRSWVGLDLRGDPTRSQL